MSVDVNRIKATHVYLAFRFCGCCVAGHVDDGSKHLKRAIGEWITRGDEVRRVPIEDARTKPEYKLGCSHLVEQQELFT